MGAARQSVFACAQATPDTLHPVLAGCATRSRRSLLAQPKLAANGPPSQRASAGQPSLASRTKAGGHDRERTCEPHHVKVMLSRRRPRQLIRKSFYPNHLEVSDFLLSYAIPLFRCLTVTRV